MNQKRGRKFVFYFILLVVGIFFIPDVFSLPEIIGTVFNSSDGTDANGYEVIMWQPVNGKLVNQKDFIGESGRCAQANCFMIDCFDDPPTNSDPCDVGDTLNIEVIETNSYTSFIKSFVITQQMIDQGNWGEAPNLTLAKNIGPNITIIRPQNQSTISGVRIVNASVKNLTLFNVSSALYSIYDESNYYDKEGNAGWSSLKRVDNTVYFNDSFDSANFANGDYKLFIKANNSKDEWSYSYHEITISNNPDLVVNDSSIIFQEENPYENQNITLSAKVFNTGKSDVNNAVVVFYYNERIRANRIDVNKTINIAAESFNITNVTFKPPVGATNISIEVDPTLSLGGEITESQENNNLANRTLVVSSYNTLIGNVSGDYVLGDSANIKLTKWNLQSVNNSNIFIADSDSSISFSDLTALSRDIGGVYKENDFTELDSILLSTDFPDSIADTFTSENLPKDTAEFIIFGNSVIDVPIINSTNSSNFITGILWDSSDDIGNDNEFDSSDKEDIVIITRVRDDYNGRYGVYDYEIKIPANLEDYTGDTPYLSIYTELK